MKIYLYRIDHLYITHAQKKQVPGKTYPLPLKIDTLQNLGISLTREYTSSRSPLPNGLGEMKSSRKVVSHLFVQKPSLI